MPERRDVDRSALGPRLAPRFVPVPDEAALRTFASGAGASPHGPVRGALHGLLRRMMSDFDADGVLGTHPMALIGPEGWRALAGDRRGRLLDVGAGSGDITVHARDVFDTLVVTETSRVMRARLRRRGFTVRAVDLSREPLDLPGFDMVSLLNVLDRCDRPRTLLQRAGEQLREGGAVLLSVPLPVRPHLDVGPVTVDPDEPLSGEGASFEEALRDLVEGTIEPLGFEIERLARAPYLSRGDRDHPVVSLDAALVVARPR